MPSANGWPFANEFDYPADHFGLTVPPAADFGLCAGMCWAALDRYVAGIPIPRELDPPEPDEPLHAELVRRQANALSRGVWDRCREWQLLPDEGSTFGAAGVADLTRKEWSAIQPALDRDQPVLLCLVRGEGAYANPSESHLVLACGYREADGYGTLRIYDPNRAGDDQLELTLSVGRRSDPLDATLSDGRAIRGFFAVPYDRTPPRPFAAEAFDDKSRIALNREIHGRPAVLADADGRLDLFVTGPDRHLLHFQRKPGRPWSGTDLTGADGIGSRYAAHGAPVAIRLPGKRTSVFVRGEFGDLLHYQSVLKWSVENLTEKRKAGPRYRIAGAPVLLEASALSHTVVARNAEGHLIRYGWTPVQGWSADDLTDNSRSTTAHTLAGDPAAVVASDDTQHVFGRAGSGDLIHYSRRPGEHWDAENLTGRLDLDGAFRIVDDPLVAHGDAGITVLGRNDDGLVVCYRRDGAAGWSAETVCDEPSGAVASPLSLVADGTGVHHLFGRERGSALLHWHRHGNAWRCENLTRLAGMGQGLRIDGAPRAVRHDDGSLFVFATLERDVVLYRWSRDAGWNADVLTRRVGIGERFRIDGQPVAVMDGLGAPHVFAADTHGTLIHYEAVTDARPVGIKATERPSQENADGGAGGGVETATLEPADADIEAPVDGEAAEPIEAPDRDPAAGAGAEPPHATGVEPAEATVAEPVETGVGEPAAAPEREQADDPLPLLEDPADAPDTGNVEEAEASLPLLADPAEEPASGADEPVDAPDPVLATGDGDAEHTDAGAALPLLEEPIAEGDDILDEGVDTAGDDVDTTSTERADDEVGGGTGTASDGVADAGPRREAGEEDPLAFLEELPGGPSDAGEADPGADTPDAAVDAHLNATEERPTDDAPAPAGPTPDGEGDPYADAPLLGVDEVTDALDALVGLDAAATSGTDARARPNAEDASGGGSDEPERSPASPDEPRLERLGDLQLLADAVDKARGPLKRIDDVEILPELMLPPDTPQAPDTAGPPAPVAEPLVDESAGASGPAPRRDLSEAEGHTTAPTRDADTGEPPEAAPPSRRAYDEAYAHVRPDDLAHAYDMPEDLGSDVPDSSLQYLSSPSDAEDTKRKPSEPASDLSKDPDYMPDRHTAVSEPASTDPAGSRLDADLPYLGELRELSAEEDDPTNPAHGDRDHPADADGERAAPPLLGMRDFET